MFGNAGFGGFSNMRTEDFEENVWGHAPATEVGLQLFRGLYY